jgi:hypothetical protein
MASKKEDQMKYLLIAVAFALAACSHSGKKDMAKDAGTDTAKAAATAEASAKDGAKDAKGANGAATAAAGEGVTCRNGNDIREISIETTDSGCSVKYTKFGTASEIASADKGSDHCKNTVEKVKGNLSAAGFSCK